MSDSVVSFLLKKLDTLITEESRLLGRVEGQLLLLKDEFEFIKTFLRDAEMKRRKSHLVEVWVVQIRDVAFDVEDVIDAHILHMEQQKAMNWAKNMFYLWKKAKTLHVIAEKIQQINERTRRISKCRRDYALDVEGNTQNSGATDISYIRRDEEIHEIEVVGFHKESTKLVSWLKEEGHPIRVISIIGMGGLGKTTLARKVYKSNDVINLFDIRVWITISQEYQVRDILLSALKQVSDYRSSGKATNEELKEELHKQLESKKYLVVIDDIWKVEAWDQISGVFPKNEKANRFILTTRNQEVAQHADPTGGNHIELSLLNEEESWELFCKKVFHQSVAACPSDLAESGKKIVKKCGGLPLAILVIGGFLMEKSRTPNEWSRVAETVSWHLSQDSNQFRQILSLSYSDLPYYLKPCFLYLSIFPEDTKIDARRVIRLWVAEGFVEPRRQVSMEVVAEDYLEELAQRSLIQVTERLYHGGPIVYFRVHDLLRDLAIEEGRKDRFIEIHNENNPSASTARARRLAIHYSGTEVEEFSTSTTPPNLRCLFLFGDISFSHGIKMLRVLDVEGHGIWKDIRKQVGKLILLHYLRISDSSVDSLPSCIDNLIKLQTLDIWGTYIGILPKSISKLKNLRHLILPSTGKVKGSVGRKEFGKDLLTLYSRGINWMNKEGGGLSKVLVNHGRLTVLHLERELAVNKEGMNLKNCFPSTLTHLTLTYTAIEEDPSDALGSLPILKVLKLQWEAYVGSKLVFSSGKFPQLQLLVLYNMYHLCEWEVEDGSIPNLRHLKIDLLQKLKKLPDGLRNVTALQKLEIFVTPQLYERVKENGQDWETIKHIPFITSCQYNLDVA